MPTDLLSGKNTNKPKDLLAKQPSTIDEIMSGPVGQVGSGILEGVASLPGLPVEIASWAKGVPLEGSNLEGWGAKGWQDFARRNIGEISAPAPTDEIGRASRKLGGFLGGGAVAGPSAMVPSLTGFVGSEIGRETDKAGLTGGYGETVGGLAGATLPGLVRGQVTAGLRKAPSNDELRAAGQAAYHAADNSGVMFTPGGLSKLADSVKSAAADFGYDPALQPGIKVVLDRLDQAAQNLTTFKGLDQVRKIANNVARDGSNPSQRSLAGSIVTKIDDFIEHAGPADVASGDTAAAQTAVRTARNLWSRLRKSEMIDEALGKAERRAASTHSGGNLDNATRQNIRAILDNPKKAKLFTKPERALMEKVVRGTASQNALRLLGKLSPDGSGLMSVFGIGATYGAGGIGAAPFLAGYVAKNIANSLTERNIKLLSEAVRRGSPGASPQAVAEKVRLIVGEAKRRAALAGQSAAPAIPGSFNTRQR